MRHLLRKFLWASAIISVVSFSATARAAGYNFANVVDTTSAGPMGPITNLNTSDYSISNGTVAFAAAYSGGSGVFTGRGGPLATIVKSGDDAPGGGTFTAAFTAASIDFGTVAFEGATSPGAAGIFKSQSGVVSTIARSGDASGIVVIDGSGSETPVTIISTRLIGNDHGEVGFFSPLKSSTVRRGIFSGDGGPLATLARSDQGAPADRFDGGMFNFSYADGTAAFKGFWGPSLNLQRQGIFLANAGAVTPVALYGDPAPAGVFTGFGSTGIGSGIAAFYGVYDVGPVRAGTGIFTGNGGPLTTIAKTGDPSPAGAFTGFDLLPGTNGTTTVFAASTTGVTNGIFTGDGSSIEKILLVGDPLFGSVVTRLELGNLDRSPQANGSRIDVYGNIAFTYTLADGRRGIAIAQLVPEPASICLLAFATAFAFSRCTHSRTARYVSTPHTIAALWLCLVTAQLQPAVADTFGSGLNTFDIEFVPVGNPGNPHDTTARPSPACTWDPADPICIPNPSGKVDYAYRIAKFEVSEQMLHKANAVDDLGFGQDSWGITNKPATRMSWNLAARFVNWLNVSTGHHVAYKFATQPGQAGYSTIYNIELWTPNDPGYDPNNLYRNSLAHYFLPSTDEWYKAAFYDATTNSYFDYPTGSDVAPTPVAGGTAPFTAVYRAHTPDPADINDAGGLSPYGTMAQGGNVWEWLESDWDLMNDSSWSLREIRGSAWNNPLEPLSSLRICDYPTSGGWDIGFRVAAVSDLHGDFNRNGTVDAADYIIWRKNPGGIYTPDDYNIWRTHFGQTISFPGSGSDTTGLSGSSVPEPTSLRLILVAAVAVFLVRRN